MIRKNSLKQLEDKNFYRELFALAIPIGLQNLLIALIGATDAFMLGRFSQDAVAAVSLANQVVFILNLFLGAITGTGGVFLAQYWGKDDKRMVRNLFCMTIKWSVFASLFFFASAMFFPELLMKLYTGDRELIRIGASYLRAVSVSYLFTGITQCYYVVMKLEGKAGKSVMISIVTLIMDVVLDLFLIYGVTTIPGLGANGSAYSTVAVEGIAFAWVVAESYKGERIRPDKSGFLWKTGKIRREILKVFLPMLGSSLAWGVGFSMHSLIMGHLGSDATAAASITSVTQEIITCICKGISAGAGILIGKLLGQNLFAQAKEYGRKFCHISFAAGGIHMLLLGGLAPLIARFFLLTETAKQYLWMMLLFSAVYVFAYSINTIIVCGIFPAGGDAKYDAVSVFFASWCLAIPMALLGAFVFRWPVMVVYMLMCSDEVVKLPWLYRRYRKFLWLKNLTSDQECVTISVEK